MIDWNKETIQSLNSLLNSWFEAGIPRSGTGTWSSAPCSTARVTADATERAILAARLYKRGLSRLVDTHTGSVTQILHDERPNLLPQLLLPHRNSTDFSHFMDELVEPWDSVTTLVIVDAKFLSAWSPFELVLRSKFPHILAIDLCEEKKGLDTVCTILAAIPPQTGNIMAIGGGLLCDVAGLVAGIAGHPVRYLATTFLSAIDAAIGGKTAVNHPLYGKNQIGLFVSIERIGVHPSLFATLTPVELVSGLCESIKHSWLQGTLPNDTSFYEEFLTNLSRPDMIDFSYFIQNGFEAKGKVISIDPTERSLRKVLNFGHTVGHLLEALGQQGLIDKMPHGIAVGFGMLCLCRAGLLDFDPQASKLNLLLEKLLKRVGFELPVTIRSGMEDATLAAAMQLLVRDKKNTDAHLVTIALPRHGFLCETLVAESESFLCRIEADRLLAQLSSHLFAHKTDGELAR